MAKTITDVGQFEDDTFYSFDDGYSDRAVGIRSSTSGDWAFIYNDTEVQTGRYTDIILGIEAVNLEVFLAGHYTRGEESLLSLNPRKVK